MQDGTGQDCTGRDGSERSGLTRSATVVVAVTLQRLVEDASRAWSVEEELVLDALRRSASRLNDATPKELAEYIASLSPDQLRGVVSNVKGIYHELLFVHAVNLDADGVTARLFEATNHPGADVEFLVDGNVIHAVQLKAVASPDTIFEHLVRYPDIEVVATQEVASRIPNVAGSGFSNAEISNDVSRVVAELPGDSLGAEMMDGAVTSALLAGAISAAQVLRSGKVTRQQFATAFGDISVGVVTATALDVLLDGLS